MQCDCVEKGMVLHQESEKEMHLRPWPEGFGEGGEGRKMLTVHECSTFEIQSGYLPMKVEGITRRHNYDHQRREAEMLTGFKQQSSCGFEVAGAQDQVPLLEHHQPAFSH